MFLIVVLYVLCKSWLSSILLPSTSRFQLPHRSHLLLSASSPSTYPATAKTNLRPASTASINMFQGIKLTSWNLLFSHTICLCVKEWVKYYLSFSFSFSFFKYPNSPFTKILSQFPVQTHSNFRCLIWSAGCVACDPRLFQLSMCPRLPGHQEKQFARLLACLLHTGCRNCNFVYISGLTLSLLRPVMTCLWRGYAWKLRVMLCC